MSMHELDDLRSQPLLAHLRDREEHAEFLSNASELLIRTCQLVTSGRDEEATLVSISRLVLPHRGVWSVLEVREGVSSRQLGASDDVPRPPLGSVLTVALSAGAETLGSLTFLAPLGGHVFDGRDRQLAKDVASGASLAIVTSRREARRKQSRTAARRAAADRFALIASVSHGLRTPLHAIYGYAQLLAEGVRGPLNAGQHADVRRILANERQLLHLVDSVISFARWDDGEVLALEDISVRAAVRLTNAIVVRAAEKNGVSYDPELNTLDAHLTVRAEPRRLREILLQLMLNAVQFSRPRDSLVVGALAVGDKVRICVTDTGVGIPKESLESIFLPLRHAKDGVAKNGVGLGLAVTRSLARAMGGELSVTSELGLGSTFTLALPRGRVS